MASTKGKLVRLISGFALEQGVVESVHPVGCFQRLQLRWDTKPFSAGAKVQLLLPSDDMRTYTPIPSQSGMVLLGWRHGDGAGSRWLTTVRRDDKIPFVGPQRSLQLDPGPVVIVGDETSVALAAAYTAERPKQVQVVIESDSASDVREAATSVGLAQLDVVARGHTDAMNDVVRHHLSNYPDAVVALTGGSELIVAMREALRHAGVRNIKTKAYWIPGKKGLD